MGAGDSLIEEGFLKLFKEADSNSVILSRKITEMAGLAKVRKGVFSMTAAGIKAACDDAKLFKQIFETFCKKFNWAFFDGYEEAHIGQFGSGFSLILLSKYGLVKREDYFYSQRYFRGIPALMDRVNPTFQTVERYCNNCYSVRTFDRFLRHFGLVEIDQERKYPAPKYITKTALFDKLISILPHREFEMD